MWQFNESKIFNVIEQELLGREGLPTIEGIRKVTLSQIIEAHQKTFTLNNLTIFSHGDLHPALMIPKL